MNIGVQQGATGKQVGQVPVASAGEFGEVLVSDLQGRFYEATYRGQMFSSGMTTTSINAATFTTADANSATLATAATATPIIGIYNPLISGVNAVILQATLSVTLTTLTTAVGPGGLVWIAYTGNNAITTGTAPFNRKTLTQAGSQCKGLAGLALTGLASIQTSVLCASGLGGGQIYNVAETATAAGFMTQMQSQNTENFDGSLIISPGGILGLFATTTPVGHSAASSLLWAEFPV
jgi:hypothetical protein